MRYRGDDTALCYSLDDSLDQTMARAEGSCSELVRHRRVDVGIVQVGSAGRSRRLGLELKRRHVSVSCSRTRQSFLTAYK